MKRPASDTPIVTTEKKATAVEAQQTKAELSSLSFYYMAGAAAPGPAVGASDGASDPSDGSSGPADCSSGPAVGASGGSSGPADGSSGPADGSSGPADDASDFDSSADDMETTLEPPLFIPSESSALAGRALLRLLRHTYAAIASMMRMNRSENAIAMMILVQSPPLEKQQQKRV